MKPVSESVKSSFALSIRLRDGFARSSTGVVLLRGIFGLVVQATRLEDTPVAPEDTPAPAGQRSGSWDNYLATGMTLAP